METVRLIHPIYLDVPMLVSFAAAVQGGLTFDTEVTHESAATQSGSSTMSGKLGVSQLFSALFDASVGSEVGDSQSDESRQVRRESKAHTEASIAILLYDKLSKQDGYLLQPEGVSDFAQLEPGVLVELAGIVSKNAVDSVIDYIDAVGILGSLDTTQSPKQARAGVQGVKQIREALDRDRKRTPISNSLLRCSQPTGLTAVLTLRTENLRDLTLSELHNNSVRVVGKVTRFVPEGKSISSFENYGLGMIDPDLLSEMFQNIASTKDTVLSLSPPTVSGPAVQVLPLMVFV